MEKVTWTKQEKGPTAMFRSSTTESAKPSLFCREKKSAITHEDKIKDWIFGLKSSHISTKYPHTHLHYIPFLGSISASKTPTNLPFKGKWRKNRGKIAVRSPTLLPLFSHTCPTVLPLKIGEQVSISPRKDIEWIENGYGMDKGKSAKVRRFQEL